MKGFLNVFLIILIILIIPCQISAKGIEVLWQKKMDEGYLGDFKLANNGTIVFLYKKDVLDKVVDLVGSDKGGYYFWYNRNINKITDYKVSPTGSNIVYTYLQKKQVGYRPVVVLVNKGQELWEVYGGESNFFSPDEERILSVSEGEYFRGVYLYDDAGNIIWKEDKLALKAGKPDNERYIYGVSDSWVYFIDIKLDKIERYSYDKKIILHSFDLINNKIFIYDGDSIICFERGKGKVWQLPLEEEVYKLRIDSENRNIHAYSTEKKFVISYDGMTVYNQKNKEEEIIKSIINSDVKYSFSKNLNYLATFKKKILTLYRIGGE
ncbi:hypothetical protein [Orenia marismortui]|uniref:Uncharacterized protein n=1 Tax=Orenia marismortui TaxID=46469 RepID=A0A4R8GXV2_9FIRM|nr:hypothetical protein [Orenia marismortui]TDX51150.1 hypothetical protein C7959_11526 [Orenia marismortui]